MKNHILFFPENHDNKVDVLLITGDVYIDHPSFGIAIIARLLESRGYSVCVVSQPEYFNSQYLDILPEPGLFIGITAGNLDSVVSNYSGNRNERKKDSYSINGEPFFENGMNKRPGRAAIVYTSFIKQRFKNIPVVLGGLEASIRRFAHYDFVQQKLRKSILVDSKADILVYSMGEKAVIEIAQRLKNKQDLSGIKGTMIPLRKGDIDGSRGLSNTVILPSFDEIISDNSLLIKATEITEENMVYDKADTLIQDNGNSAVIAFPPQPYPDINEMDEIYSLPFRKDYPEYCKDVPAWNMIKDSITSHRGCYGKCSFCAISIHQGPVISMRSHESIINEIRKLTLKDFFKKTVSDIGGPTANMYGTSCKINWCKDPHCLYPEVCKNLIINENIYINLLENAMKLDDVKNVFVSSGIRHDLALLKENETEFIIINCTSGHLKIAPEHIDDEVLFLMRKPVNGIFMKFIEFFQKIKNKYKLNFYILPYLILSHPGSDDKSAEKLGIFLKENKISTHQYQDFTPVPGTMSTAMYFAGKTFTGKSISKGFSSQSKNSQREILRKYLTRK
jgi:uncharacterized radical SAM protein YgiQ